MITIECIVMIVIDRAKVRTFTRDIDFANPPRVATLIPAEVFDHQSGRDFEFCLLTVGELDRGQSDNPRYSFLPRPKPKLGGPPHDQEKFEQGLISMFHSDPRWQLTL